MHDPITTPTPDTLRITDDADIIAMFIVVLAWASSMYLTLSLTVDILEAVFGWAGDIL